MHPKVIATHRSDLPAKQVLAERITILADHEQTGSYEVVLHDAPEGAGPLPHAHPWDEAFYVIQGTVEFSCGGVNATISAGGFVHVPAGTVHAFRYASPTTQILGITSGAGAAALFTAMDRECGPNTDLDAIVAVALRQGLTLP